MTFWIDESSLFTVELEASENAGLLAAYLAGFGGATETEAEYD